MLHKFFDAYWGHVTSRKLPRHPAAAQGLRPSAPPALRRTRPGLNPGSAHFIKWRLLLKTFLGDYESFHYSKETAWI